MARPCLEVFIGARDEAYPDDRYALNPLLDLICAAEGCLSIYHGVAIEDPDLLLIFVVWSTLDDSLALAPTHRAAGRVPDGMSTLCAVLDADLEPILRALYVSFDHVFSARPGMTSEDVLRAAKDIHRVIAPANGCTGGGAGKVLGKDEWVLLYGWDDPKYHVQAARQDHVKPVGKTWHEVVDVVKAVNVPLTTYKKYDG